MDPLTRELEGLERKIERLRREYDLFLAGRRRGEPTGLRDEVEREVLRLTRAPAPSTALRFRTKTLAHRFRAVETQLRNQMELRASRRRNREEGTEESAGGESVTVDRSGLEHPGRLGPGLRRLHRAVTRALADRPAPVLEDLEERLLSQARRLLERPGVRGVRFSVVTDGDRPRIRGQVVAEEDGT